MCFLDVALSNLNKTLTTKIATVKAQTSTKQKLAGIQKQLVFYDKIKADKSDTTNILNALEAATPNEVTLRRISLSKNGLDLSTEIRSGTAFGKFLLELKNKSVFKEIGLKSASWDDKNQYFIASLTISLWQRHAPNLLIGTFVLIWETHQKAITLS